MLYTFYLSTINAAENTTIPQKKDINAILGIDYKKSIEEIQKLVKNLSDQREALAIYLRPQIPPRLYNAVVGWGRTIDFTPEKFEITDDMTSDAARARVEAERASTMTRVRPAFYIPPEVVQEITAKKDAINTTKKSLQEKYIYNRNTLSERIEALNESQENPEREQDVKALEKELERLDKWAWHNAFYA